MPEETETVNGNPAPEQKPDVQNGTEPQSNGEHVQTESNRQEVDVCTLKAKIASEPEAVEVPACPLIKKPEEELPSIEVQESLDNISETANGITVETSEEPAPKAVEEQAASIVEEISQPEVPSEPKAPQLVEESAKTPEPEVQPIESTPAQKPQAEIPELQVEQVEIVQFNIQPAEVQVQEPVSNGQSNGDAVVDAEDESVLKAKVLNGTIANELKTEDYKLPEVIEVKKHFEPAEQAVQNDAPQLPRKGALTTNLDAAGVRNAYEDVRRDGSDTQWAVFKYEGPKLVTSATGTDFDQFRNQFGDEDRAFGYLRVQTGDEMSKRAKFLLVTWVGPSVSVLKRAKMSTDKALIKGVVSNFAVELQTENIADINLENFENELAKAGGAHYGTGVRS